MIKKTIKIPQFLNDVLGEKQSTIELGLIFLFTIFAGILTMYFYGDELNGLALWRKIGALLLVLDIYAGCIANFTRGTSSFYAKRKNNRLVFIIIHIHLLVLSFLISSTVTTSVVVTWIYTVACTLFINFNINHPAQKTMAATFTFLGLILLSVLTWNSRIIYLSSLFFLIKVTYSFAVDHYFDNSNKSIE